MPTPQPDQLVNKALVTIDTDSLHKDEIKRSVYTLGIIHIHLLKDKMWHRPIYTTYSEKQHKVLD